MADVWSGSPQAYRGTAVAGFPNLFFLTGPNTGLGHNSLVFMIEAQLELRAWTRCAQMRAARRDRGSRSGRDAAGAPTTPTSSAASGGRCGTPAAARAGTSTRTAATRRSGPTSRGASGGRRAASTPRRTCCQRRLGGGRDAPAHGFLDALRRDDGRGAARSGAQPPRAPRPARPHAAMAAGAVLVDIRAESQRAADGVVPDAAVHPAQRARVALRPGLGARATSASPPEPRRSS